MPTRDVDARRSPGPLDHREALADAHRQLLEALDGSHAAEVIGARWRVFVVAHSVARDTLCARFLSGIPGGARDFGVEANPIDG